MSSSPLNILFLCTGNSCRSIMAESLIGRYGAGRFRSYSAGSHPAGSVNPHTLALLDRLGQPSDGLRSKSWLEYGVENEPGPVEMQIVITVCDNAAGEVCPIWPGHPTTAHWPFRDPFVFKGSFEEKAAEYAAVYGAMEISIIALVALPLETLDEESLRERLAAIGRAT
ncbi:MAG: arsenate reductase ArsC [Alphaproteobacteria bacterium]